MDVLEAIREGFCEAGFLHRVVGIEAVRNLEETFAMLRERGLLSESLYVEYADAMEFAAPAGGGEVRSLVVVAAPSPPAKVLFHVDRGPLEVILPPTYIRSGIRARGRELLEAVLSPAGFSVAAVRTAAKLLAVRSGLAEYGRNNIAYVRGLGSFARLEVFATDADLVPASEPRAGLSPFIVGGREPTSGHWSSPRRMGSCSVCKACHQACPTGCIPPPDEGVMIDALRCLTYVNEHEGPWPEWLSAGAHHCLLGCMRCQEVCPANEQYSRREELVAEFDPEETAIVLRDLPAEELPAVLRTKLGLLDLEGYSTVLGRNLRALVG